MGRAFTARYPGITVKVVRSTSPVAYQRLSQGIRAEVDFANRGAAVPDGLVAG